jgi:hypothetical protein
MPKILANIGLNLRFDTLALLASPDYTGDERLARAGTSPTRSGPEGSSRNEPRLGRCPASHLNYQQAVGLKAILVNLSSAMPRRKRPCGLI